MDSVTVVKAQRRLGLEVRHSLGCLTGGGGAFCWLPPPSKGCPSPCEVCGGFPREETPGLTRWLGRGGRAFRAEPELGGSRKLACLGGGWRPEGWVIIIPALIWTCPSIPRASLGPLCRSYPSSPVISREAGERGAGGQGRGWRPGLRSSREAGGQIQMSKE